MVFENRPFTIYNISHMKNPLVSIIIPTKNAAEFLEKTLTSVKAQTYKHLEVILVDNYSTDNTVKIAKKYTKNIYFKGNERGAQTNYGIRKAKGKYCYRIDGDFVLDKDIVKEAVEKCEKEHLDGVAVHNVSVPSISFWAKVRQFERDMYVNDDLIVGLRFYKKSAWKKIGGYNEEVVWDDYDLHNRFINAGFKWGRIRSREYHLGEPKTITELFRKSIFYGQEMVSFLKHNSTKRGFQQVNPIRTSYFGHWKKFLKNPSLAMGFMIMLVVKYTGGMVGFTKGILTYKNNDLSKK